MDINYRGTRRFGLVTPLKTNGTKPNKAREREINFEPKANESETTSALHVSVDCFFSHLISSDGFPLISFFTRLHRLHRFVARIVDFVSCPPLSQISIRRRCEMKCSENKTDDLKLRESMCVCVQCAHFLKKNWMDGKSASSALKLSTFKCCFYIVWAHIYLSASKCATTINKWENEKDLQSRRRCEWIKNETKLNHADGIAPNNNNGKSDTECVCVCLCATQSELINR